MLDTFVLRALAAGLGVALVCGVLGCFVVWRRMAYFGDSLAHSALLGIALGLLYGFWIDLGIILVSSIFAILLVWLQHRRILATDTLLGILAHSALSIGMIAISFVKNRPFDLHSYLFGDVLAVTSTDLYWLYGGAIIVLALLIFNWSSLTLMTIHEGLAKAEGVNTMWMNLLLVLLMTIIVSISIRIVGILLITSMLIIPAAASRQLARSPEMMAILAACIGMLSVVIGIVACLYVDIPSGPSIVTASTILFVLMIPLSKIILLKKNTQRS